MCAPSRRQQTRPPVPEFRDQSRVGGGQWPSHLLGRVTSAFWTAHSALAPLGAAAITGLVEAYGMRGPLLGVGAVFLLVVLVGLGTPVRLRHPERTVVSTEAAGVAVSPR